MKNPFSTDLVSLCPSVPHVLTICFWNLWARSVSQACWQCNWDTMALPDMLNNNKPSYGPTYCNCSHLWVACRKQKYHPDLPRCWFHESDTAFSMSPVWEALCFYFKPGCTRSSSQIVVLPPPPFPCGLPYRWEVGKVLTGERRVTHSQGFRPLPHQVPRFLRSFCCFQPFSLSLSKHVLSTYLCVIGPRAAVGIPAAETCRGLQAHPHMDVLLCSVQHSHLWL